MEQFILVLLVLRILISFIGLLGNTVLIIAILHMPRLKTFEVFLFGLAVSNLGEILTVDVYDIIIRSVDDISIWSCSVLKFMTVSGELASIFFTVLISIFRYQKIHNAAAHIIQPIFMDSIRVAFVLSIGCILAALLLGVPTYITGQNLDMQINNTTAVNCPADFFHCSKDYCPMVKNIYKYVFIFLCHFLPLIIVTGTSSMIIRILTVQQKLVDAHHDSEPAAIAVHHHNEHSVFHRSTTGILAAMSLFQVDCILYLMLHLMFSPYDFPAWSELEFFITTSYAAIIPYIYGMGHNFFTLKHFRGE